MCQKVISGISWEKNHLGKENKNSQNPWEEKNHLQEESSLHQLEKEKSHGKDEGGRANVVWERS